MLSGTRDARDISIISDGSLHNMLNFWKDIQYAFRTLTKNPGFAFIGILTLALGMAVNTTLFSVVNGFLLRPLPVPHPEQITVLALQQAAVPGIHHFSYP